MNWTQTIQKWMEDPARCVVATFFAALLISVLLTSWIRPLPRVHDEFSYLLAADALSQLSTSAETHAHWEHFESFHTIHQPRYASKFTPGQSLTLAFGKRLGHPIFGSNLTNAFALASLMWLLVGWIPRSTHWLACLLLSFHPGIQVIWGQSYMGGSLAVAGSALLVGAFFRVDKQLKIGNSVIAAIGIALLMYTRPMEGCVLTATVIAALVFWLFSDKDVAFGKFIRRVAVPAGVVIVVAAGSLAAYNYSVTGNASCMPYQVYEDRYGWVPLFLWQQLPEQMPGYNHREFENFYQEDFDKRVQKFSSPGAMLVDRGKFAIGSSCFYLGGALILAVLAMPLLLSQSRTRVAIWLAMPALAAGFATPWSAAHYLAPAGSILILLGFIGLNHVSEKASKTGSQRLVAVAIVLLHLLSFIILLYQLKSEYHEAWWVRRHEVEQKLLEQPGRDLVFVRYEDGHDHHQEWVYNLANIDESEVVWAREMSPEKDAELREYFSSRNVWLVEPDKKDSPLTSF